jgi:hypothetical protein
MGNKIPLFVEASLQVKFFCVGISISQVMQPETQTSNCTLQRSKDKAVPLQFLQQPYLFSRQQPAVLRHLQPVQHLASQPQLRIDISNHLMPQDCNLRANLLSFIDTLSKGQEERTD